MDNKTKEPTRIILELLPEGNLSIACSWPLPNNMDEAKETIAGLSNLIVAMNTGKLLHGFQYAVSNFGENNEILKQMSRTILGGIQGILQGRGNLSLTSSDDDKPVVLPTEAFQVRGG